MRPDFALSVFALPLIGAIGYVSLGDSFMA
jgi:hypothetical protein